MATKPARIEFRYDKETLKFSHNIPSSLIGRNSESSQQDPQYVNTFLTTIKPIIAQHHWTVFDASDAVCCICQSPKTIAITTPMSWLHNASDPFVWVMCEAACNKPACDTKIKQNVQALMADMAGMESPAGVGPEKSCEIMPCRVCKSIEKTFKCARCRIAFYCGKEHQKMDWPVHKKACKAA